MNKEVKKTNKIFLAVIGILMAMALTSTFIGRVINRASEPYDTDMTPDMYHICIECEECGYSNYTVSFSDSELRELYPDYHRETDVWGIYTIAQEIHNSNYHSERIGD